MFLPILSGNHLILTTTKHTAKHNFAGGTGKCTIIPSWELDDGQTVITPRNKCCIYAGFFTGQPFELFTSNCSYVRRYRTVKDVPVPYGTPQ